MTNNLTMTENLNLSSRNLAKDDFELAYRKVLVRLALGLRVFDRFYIPEKGQGIGHPFEYSDIHLKWHLERAGFESVKIELHQLYNVGSTPLTQIGRIIASPLSLRPLWRDSLVAVAQRPD
jgi:hypothetical protein